MRRSQPVVVCIIRKTKCTGFVFSGLWYVGRDEFVFFRLAKSSLKLCTVDVITSWIVGKELFQTLFFFVRRNAFIAQLQNRPKNVRLRLSSGVFEALLECACMTDCVLALLLHLSLFDVQPF